MQTLDLLSEWHILGSLPSALGIVAYKDVNGPIARQLQMLVALALHVYCSEWPSSVCLQQRSPRSSKRCQPCHLVHCTVVLMKQCALHTQ